MKPLLARLHRYVALSVGVVIAMMGLTGALLVFKGSLEERLYPERNVTRPAGANPSYEAVLRAARIAVPAADSYVINVPADPSRAWNVHAEGPEARRLFIDPYSGKLISNKGESALALDWVAELHVHLLAGDTGKSIVGAFGGVLVFLAVTGVILWWPRKWKNALRVRWSSTRLGLNYDLHKVAGAMFALFLLVSAVTGIALAYSAAVGRLVGSLSGTPMPPPPQLASRDPAQSRRAPLDDVVKAAIEALPAARLKRVIVPNAETAVLARLQAPGDHHPNGQNRVFVDPYDARVLKVVPLAEAAGLRLFDWVYPLHIGRLFGAGHQVFQLLVGLTPAFMLMTGLVVWWSSRKARRRPPVGSPSAKPRDRMTTT